MDFDKLSISELESLQDLSTRLYRYCYEQSNDNFQSLVEYTFIKNDRSYYSSYFTEQVIIALQFGDIDNAIAWVNWLNEKIDTAYHLYD